MDPSDAELHELLRQVRTIAVVGIKAGANDDAFRVPRAMQSRGYRIYPVSPKLDRVIGETCVASLAELRDSVDLVNVFRASPHIPTHADEILALSPLPRGVWLQLGIRHDESARRLESAGVMVVQDRCLMVEHGRLFRAGN